MAVFLLIQCVSLKTPSPPGHGGLLLYAVTAADGLAQVAKNDMKEVVMATPAISDGLIIVRTLGHLYGIGN